MLKALREQNRIVSRRSSPTRNVYESLKSLEGYIGGEWGDAQHRTPLIDKSVRDFCDVVETILWKISSKECDLIDRAIFNIDDGTEVKLREGEKKVSNLIKERISHLRKIDKML